MEKNKNNSSYSLSFIFFCLFRICIRLLFCCLLLMNMSLNCFHFWILVCSQWWFIETILSEIESFNVTTTYLINNFVLLCCWLLCSTHSAVCIYYTVFLVNRERYYKYLIFLLFLLPFIFIAEEAFFVIIDQVDQVDEIEVIDKGTSVLFCIDLFFCLVNLFIFLLFA